MWLTDQILPPELQFSEGKHIGGRENKRVHFVQSGEKEESKKWEEKEREWQCCLKDGRRQWGRDAEQTQRRWTLSLGHAAPANPPVFQLSAGATGLPTCKGASEPGWQRLAH